jgi:DNA topoisomerase-1
LRQHGVLAVHSTGAGKTLSAASAAACLYTHGIVTRTIVITKKSVIDQFEAEVRRFWADTQPGHEVHCVTHVTLFKDIAKYTKDISKTFLVVDEAHEFVNPEAVGTQHLLKLGASAARVLLLTATPIINASYDVAILAAIARGQTSPPSLTEFEQMLNTKSKFKRYFGGYVDMYLVDKNSDPHYPKVKMNRIVLPMSPKTYQAYMQAPSAPFDINLRQLSLGTSDTDKGTCEKCQWLRTMIPKWIKQGEGKIVLYTAFIGTGTIRLIALLKDAGINTLLLDGSSTALQRRAMALLFNRAPEEETAGRRDLRHLVNAADDSNANAKAKRKTDGPRCGPHIKMMRADSQKAWHNAQGHMIPENTAKTYLDNLPPIPPKWIDVEVCEPGARGGLAWVARDGKNNFQYRYTEDWTVQQEYKKIVRLKALDNGFWQRFDRTVDGHMNHKKGSAKHLLAIATRLLQSCHFRVGSREDNDHYGLMTLRAEHVDEQQGGSIRITFIGKAGKQNVCQIPLQSRLATEVLQLVKDQRSDGKLFPNDIGATALRGYLSSLRTGLRPKDFRTYRANYVIMDHLKHQPYAHDQTARQRRARINAAVTAASKDLNNTPNVCKKSYVFSAFWVLYLTDPNHFHRVLARSKSSATHDVLATFVQYFDKNAIDWQHMLKQFREGRGVADFIGTANVLLITDAGAESIDLKAVRHIVLIDPTWTPALEDQIIGRGQRYNSHASLPPTKKNLNVWKLMLDFPDKREARRRRGDGDADDSSVEVRMDSVVSQKRKAQEDMFARLRQL